MKSLRRPRRYHVLNRNALKIRPTWNKYNLYNMARYVHPSDRLMSRTFFQQKWIAKRVARAYHGEHIREKKWRRMFSRRLDAVVEMPAAYLARHDGAEQGAGRGSGRDVAPGQVAPRASDFSAVDGARYRALQRELLGGSAKDATWTHRAQRSRARRHPGAMHLAKPVQRMTPYMQMTFAPLERRLDMAVWRALFASSVRQARQFCVHGAVKVNGKKIRWPNYLLNPGDMFQVEPERVLLATGQPKDPLEIQKFEEDLQGRLAEVQAGEETEAAQLAEIAERFGGDKSKTAESASSLVDNASSTEAQRDPEETKAAMHAQLKSLVRSAREILADPTAVLSAKRKQQLRAFRDQARSAMSYVKKESADESKIMDDLSAVLRDFKLSGDQVVPASPQETQRSKTQIKSGEEGLDALGEAADDAATVDKLELSDEEQARIAQLLDLDAQNPIDPSKPYRTPWAPRKYLSPFAFIPRYLEVNQNVCAAVYLRHPVARPGLSEVPTPMPYDVSQLAFNWYLRRR